MNVVVGSWEFALLFIYGATASHKALERFSCGIYKLIISRPEQGSANPARVPPAQ